MARSRDPLEAVIEALGCTVVAGIVGVHPHTLQRVEKLGRICAELLALFQKEDAIRWLQIPNPVLANQPPVDVMKDEGGLDRVLDVIGQLQLGFAS
jgi:uncharacterized protein (DUF2384 family)